MYVYSWIVFFASVCYAFHYTNFSKIFFNGITDFNSSYNGNVFQLKDSKSVDDSKLTVPEIIAKYGYDAEVHYVTTEDGYIIQLHRIAGSPKSPPKVGKKACFIMHALMLSSSAFMISGPDHALAYKLADEGYDVWLGNNRGNIYAVNHTTLNPFGTRSQRKKFWKYSLNEIGVYDVTGSIDYILNHTGQSKLTYFGHSQGTAIFFIMLSERPDYNEKVELMFAMAPAAIIGRLHSPPMRFVAPWAGTLAKSIKKTGTYSIFVTDIPICKGFRLTLPFCQAIMDIFVGETDQQNSTLLSLFFAHNPNSASFDQLVHFAQLATTGRFQKFDYGREENLIRYKQETPPEYNLKNVKVPVAVYYGKTDSLAVVEDVRKLIRELPNVVKDYLVPHEKTSHLDFIWGAITQRLVFNDMISTMKSRECAQKIIQTV